MNTTFKSLGDSTLDEVIQLSHSSAAKPKKILADVRPVVYSDTAEILALLAATHILRLSSVANDVKAINVTTTSSLASASENRVDSNREDLTVEAQDLEPEDEQETTPPLIEFTDDQMTAASKITTVYRNYALRKAAAKDTLSEMRHRIFRDFLANSRTIAWQGSPYRFIFLGAVPYLLAVTEILKDHLLQAKSSAKESLRNAHDAALESVQAALDGAS